MQKSDWPQKGSHLREIWEEKYNGQHNPIQHRQRGKTSSLLLVWKQCLCTGTARYFLETLSGDSAGNSEGKWIKPRQVIAFAELIQLTCWHFFHASILNGVYCASGSFGRAWDLFALIFLWVRFIYCSKNFVLTVKTLIGQVPMGIHHTEMDGSSRQ